MPTILLLSDAGSIHTVRWVNAIAARNWKVHLFSLQRPRDPIDERVVLHLAPRPAPMGYLTNAALLRRRVQELEPDLVHAHYVSGYGTLATLLAPHPLVLSVWGSDIYEFPSTSPLHAWLIRRNLRKADLILSTSQAMAHRTRCFTNQEIRITPFGVDLTKFRAMSVPSPYTTSDIVIGAVKSLADTYGIEYLIRAFGLLRKRHPRLPLKLLLVGGGPQEAALKHLVGDLGLHHDTKFTGRVEHGLIPDYQNMLSISVSVSNSESFGVAVLEASACEKPVVVSSVGGLPEVVEDGVTGIVVPPRDPVRTAAAIERLIVDQPLRLTMGKAGRERVKRLYEWEQCVDRMMNVYRSLIRPNRGS